MSSLGSRLSQAVMQHNLEVPYLLQAVPVIGAVVSIPTALYTGAKAVANFAKAAFSFTVSKLSKESESAKSLTDRKFSLENSADFAFLFADNILNILTLGVLNSIAVCVILNNMRFGCGGDM